jgi:ankyrin repeat protein
MNRAANSIEELFPVAAFARAGDLKSVKVWIDSGAPLNKPSAKKTKHQSPLQIAIDKGFLTLTEVLLDGGADPKADEALKLAVRRGRTDIAKLLLDRGANVSEVSFWEVCYNNNVEMVRLFLDRGADPVAGSPFCEALKYVLKPLLGLFKELLTEDSRLQPQADAALAHYVEEKNLRGIALMVWAGAKPDAANPTEVEGDTDSPLEVAARSGDLGTLKALKPEKYPAMLPRLVRAASADTSQELLKYLLSMGAPINDEPDGTSSLLRMALWRVDLHSSARYGGYPDSQRADQTIAVVDDLLAKGAKFPPMEVREIRSNLKSVSQERLIRLIGILQKGAAFPAGTLLEVISTAKFKSILGTRWPAAARIASGEPEAPPVLKLAPSKRIEPQDPAELRERAEQALVHFIRHQGHVPFLDREVSKHWSRGEFRRRIKLDDDGKVNEETVLKDACRALSKRLKSVDLTVETSEYHSFPYPVFRLREDTTWEQAIREVCQVDACDLAPLTPSAERFLDLAEKLGAKWITREELTRKVGGSRYTRVEVKHNEEIAARRGIKINVLTRRQEGPLKEEEMQITITSRQDPTARAALKTVVNFRWNDGFDHKKKADVDRFRDAILDLVLERDPPGIEPLYLFKAHTPAGLAKAFPKLSLKRYEASGALCGLLHALRLPEGLRLAYDLQDSASEWWAAVAPATSWPEAIVSVQAFRKRLTPEQHFGLSHDAARLLEWIESRDKKEMLGSWTPVVEPAVTREIGLLSEWPEENLAALFQMLVDEINDKTIYQLGLQPWKEQGQIRTRIKVAKRASKHESMAQTIARAAKETGIGLTDEQIEKMVLAIGRPG